MTLKMTSAEIRQGYIDFFVQKHGHTFVPSSPVVPHDDPTLLFTNAGMNQFKPIFLGQEKRAYTRAANTQKCIRAGGKHNDLDDVGRSRRHHTFFEMLGNWSFGDYFKQGAIEMSWELLTKVWKLDPKRLHVTCFEGDEKNGVPRDLEAADIWRKVANWEQYGLKSDDHIHFFGAKDNFWEMGDTGPCGPCTEINVDRRPQAEIDEERRQGKRAPVNGDDPRVMEIWNNVFIQYNRNPDRTLTVLPAQHVDTGMGFERVTQVIQGVDSNYEIDLFHPFWAKLKELSGFTYGGKYPPTNAADPVAEAADASLRHDIAFRVIADHIRCLTFALTDGATPSNEGRGYVLRRILRRAVRFGRQQLELKDPFLYKLVDVVVTAMGDAFPELKKNPARVVELVKDEEISFGKTLDRGIELFEDEYVKAITSARIPRTVPYGSPSLDARAEDKRAVSFFEKRPGAEHVSFARQPRIAADAAFKLHDTYGFPIDLTRIMAEERGMTVDIEGYERLMEEAKEKARSGGKGEASAVTNLPPAALDQLAKQGVSPTSDTPKFSQTPVTAKVVAIWDGSALVSSSPATEAAVLLDQTNFYAEMGGQVGDTGALVSSSGTFNVATTKTVGHYSLHIGTGSVKVGDTVTATVGTNRALTQKNHTSTHLANWALREILGDGVQQKGSLVDPEKLRFDFSHGKALELSEVEKVESLVNSAIAKRLPVYAEEAPQEQALKIAGLRAVFGEKYPPMVRVVSIGAPVKDLLADPANEKWRQFSIEFCGGTHLKSSADAEAFVITEESSVSKGIRRIVALTGMAASAAMKLSTEVDAAIKSGDLPALQKLVPTPNIPLLAKRRAQAAILDLQAKLKAAEKAAKSAGSGVDAVAIASELLAAAPTLGPGKLVVGAIPGASDDQLRGALDSLRKKQPSLALMLGAIDGEKVSFLAAVSDDLIALGLKSGDWIRETAKIAGGGGGGRPQMAQAGGKNPAKLHDALAKATEFALATVK
jgi:alanyl-tRNA synthetase